MTIYNHDVLCKNEVWVHAIGQPTEDNDDDDDDGGDGDGDDDD